MRQWTAMKEKGKVDNCIVNIFLNSSLLVSVNDDHTSTGSNVRIKGINDRWDDISLKQRASQIHVWLCKRILRSVPKPSQLRISLRASYPPTNQKQAMLFGNKLSIYIMLSLY